MGIKTIILITMLLSAIGYAQAQSAGDIDTLSQWRVDNVQSYGMQYDHFKNYIAGKITVGTLEYYKVYKSGYYHYEMWGTPIYYDHVYCGALREEGNKWYTLDYGDKDTLLYDFTMNIGDTVNSFAAWGLITVTDIDTIQVDGEPKKRFHLSCANGNSADYIIEDVGAYTGLFDPLLWFENNSILHCFAIDFVPLWINSLGLECDLSVGVEQYSNDSYFSIYPNPFTTATTLSYTLEKPENVQIILYNLQGQIVARMQEKQDKGMQRVKWNAEGLPAGLYIIRLEAGNNIAFSKLLLAR